LHEPRWLTRRVVDTIHSELLAEHGGTSGVRAGGDGLIESALARPHNRLAYDPECDLATLAAAYLYGLVTNHGYVDGNKRVAFAAAATFLVVNGAELTADEAAAYDTVIAVAAGRVGEEELAGWIRDHSVRG
jgi:death-on-curing protein